MGAITDGYRLNLTKSGTCTATNRTDTNYTVSSNATTGMVLPPIQSARLTTKNTRPIKYGRVEVRARLPKGDWMWPAIWLMPKDSVYGEWPASGEIDIVESKGNVAKSRSDQLGNVVRSSLHYGPTPDQDCWWSSTSISQLWRNYFNNEFHTFGLEWDEKSIWTWQGSRTRMFLKKGLTQTCLPAQTLRATVATERQSQIPGKPASIQTSPPSTKNSISS